MAKEARTSIPARVFERKARRLGRTHSRAIARVVVALSSSVCVLFASRSTQATYSAVALERASGRYGAVSASCVELSSLLHVYASVPGRGAVLTQAQLVDRDASQALALQLLGQGASATEVVDAMTDQSFDTDFSLRQYVVLDVEGRVAAFSGSRTEPHAGHLDASDESFSVGIAGNFLTGAGVLEAAQLGFRDETACDLEQRLVNALVAASEGDLGDDRCVEEGRPAQSAWLHVASSSSAEDLDITVDAGAGINPILQVVTRFAAWRSRHPCPSEPETSNAPPSSEKRDSASHGCSVAHAGRGSLESWFWLLALLRRRRTRDVSLRG